MAPFPRVCARSRFACAFPLAGASLGFRSVQTVQALPNGRQLGAQSFGLLAQRIGFLRRVRRGVGRASRKGRPSRHAGGVEAVAKTPPRPSALSCPFASSRPSAPAGAEAHAVVRSRPGAPGGVARKSGPIVSGAKARASSCQGSHSGGTSPISSWHDRILSSSLKIRDLDSPFRAVPFGVRGLVAGDRFCPVHIRAWQRRHQTGGLPARRR